MGVRGQKLEICPIHSHVWNNFGIILFFPVKENYNYNYNYNYSSKKFTNPTFLHFCKPLKSI